MPQYITTAEAAMLMGVSTVTFRSNARFARGRGIELRAPEEEWIDRRTPLYDMDAIIRYRDEQRPNRDWPLSLEEQKALKEQKATNAPKRAKTKKAAAQS